MNHRLNATRATGPLTLDRLLDRMSDVLRARPRDVDPARVVCATSGGRGSTSPPTLRPEPPSDGPAKSSAIPLAERCGRSSAGI